MVILHIPHSVIVFTVLNFTWYDELILHELPVPCEVYWTVICCAADACQVEPDCCRATLASVTTLTPDRELQLIMI
jgi:hypothetical protein